MDNEKYLRTFIIIAFIIFIGLYVTNVTGYKEYELHKRTELTKEQINKFETDVKENKYIDINDYINNDDVNYSNGVSKVSLTFSNTTSKYIKEIINKAIKLINKLLNN
jgi:ABC-type dipeptide/oligopeptide/nickel transport system permease component